jgi:tRNA uridine 5-carbamoylmethylation protein Kti12
MDDYYEEEEEELWEGDIDYDDDEANLKAIHASFQRLANERKQQQFNIDNQYSYETVTVDDDDDDISMLDDEDDDKDYLQGVRSQMHQLFQEQRKAKVVQAMASSRSTIFSYDEDDEPFEEQIVERWFGRDTLPGK